MSETKKIEILKRVLGRPIRKDSEYLFFCPKCEHHKKKLSVNITKNVFKCWVCDWSSRNVGRIISRFASYSDRQAWRDLTQDLDGDRFSLKLLAHSQTSDVAAQKLELPKEFVSLANKNLPHTSMHPINYLNSRGLGRADIIKWKIGYCSAGRYAGRIIVPSFDLDGDVNYYIARSYDNNWKKYLNPDCPKDVIFNHLSLDFSRDLILVEGVFDAIKAGDNAVPLLGSTLRENSDLFYEIIKNDTSVYLALDLDAAKKTAKLIRSFLKYDVELYRVDTRPYADIGEMTHGEFLERKQSASLLNSDNYLLSRIMGI